MESGATGVAVPLWLLPVWLLIRDGGNLASTSYYSESASFARLLPPGPSAFSFSPKRRNNKSRAARWREPAHRATQPGASSLSLADRNLCSARVMIVETGWARVAVPFAPPAARHCALFSPLPAAQRRFRNTKQLRLPSPRSSQGSRHSAWRVRGAAILHDFLGWPWKL